MTRTVVLLRHAEEPPPKTKSLDLSKAGRRRAERLAEYLVKEFGKPDFLFASSPGAESVRTYLTLRPLADATESIIDASYDAREFVYLASKLLYDPKFDDALVVVAWTHKELPALGAALGATRDAFPSEWDEGVFDVCYEFKYGKKGLKIRSFDQPF